MDSPEVVNHQQQQVKYEPYSPQSSYAHTGASSTPVPVPYAGLEVAPQQPGQYHYGPPPGEHRRICGIARSTFILAVILVVVIIAAAVGGGVGGSVAVSNAKKSACDTNNGSATGGNATVVTSTVTVTADSATGTATGTATSTSASVFTAPTDVMLALDCPNIDGSNQVISLGDDTYTYEAKCGYDFNGDIDILGVTAYSFRDCLKACSSYNRNRGSNDCLAVSFSADMKDIVPDNFGTCFLKTGTGTQHNYNRNTNVAATLVSS